MSASGPLVGYKIVELAGIGPNPMCAMMLADMGAEIVRIDRTVDAGLGINTEAKFRVLDRGRRSVAVNLKDERGVQTVLKLVEQADALIEGFRPGVTERLGLGPEVCMKINPKLVYGRITGWGQDGPLASAAGHDINYVLWLVRLSYRGCGFPAVPPLNLVGDFGGGMLLALGVVGTIGGTKVGVGQIVDAAMTDGVAH